MCVDVCRCGWRCVGAFVWRVDVATVYVMVYSCYLVVCVGRCVVVCVEVRVEVCVCGGVDVGSVYVMVY